MGVQFRERVTELQRAHTCKGALMCAIRVHISRRNDPHPYHGLGGEVRTEANGADAFEGN